MDPLSYSYNDKVLKTNSAVARLPNEIQEELLKKNIVFQGRRISFKELFKGELPENYEERIDYEALRELLQNDTISVGSEVPCLDEGIKYCYIQRNFKNYWSVEMDEEYICKSKEKMKLIYGIEGIGKGTVFMNLAQTIKKENPHLWVIKMELNDYTNILENLQRNNVESVTIWDLLESKDTRLNQLEKIVFSMKKKVILLLNIDETNPKFIALIVNLLTHCLLAPNFVKVLVSIRPNIVKELEANLQLKRVILQPFSEQDQVNFLTKYWMHYLKLGNENKERCEDYSRALLKRILWKVSLFQEMEHVPVQFMMLGDIFKENFKSTGLEVWHGCKYFITANEKEPKLPEKFDVIKLYEMFMEKKRNNFLNEGIVVEKQKRYEECISFYRTLALETIVDKDTCKHFLSYQPGVTNISADVLKMGIVRKYGNEYRFIHRSVAEYFLGECSVRELQYNNQDADFQEFVVEKILPSFNLSVTRAFFNTFLKYHIDSLPFDIFQSYIDNIKERKFYVYFLLHYLVWDGYIPILKLVLKSMNYQKIKDKGNTRGNTSYKCCNVFQFLILNDGIDIHDERGTRPLHDAVRKGYLEVVKFLVEQGANISIENDSGNTPLLIAVWGGCFDIVKFLVERADDATTFIGKRAFYASIQRNNTSIAEYFFDKVFNKCDDTMIAYAASFLGRLDILERILNRGFDVNTKFQNQKMLIFSAVIGEQSHIIKYLVEKGADINIRNADGETVLFSWHEIHIAKLLLELGIDINVKSSYLLKTALHGAAERGELDIVHLLAENGADIHAKDIHKRSVLRSAISESHRDVAMYLIKAGADVNEGEDFQQTCLYCCIMKNDLDMVKFLVDNGADVYMKDSRGYNALHIAALQGFLNIAEYFIEYGMKLEQNQAVLDFVISRGRLDIVKFCLKYGMDGRTALFPAITNSQLEIVVFLVIEGHVDANVVGDMGRTALHLAVLNSNLSIVQFLITECGVDVNARDKEGCTAFHLTELHTYSYRFYIDNPVTNAQLNACLSILKYLMSHGASIYDTNSRGNTAETLARKTKTRDRKENELFKCLRIWRITVECAVFMQRLSKGIGITD